MLRRLAKRIYVPLPDELARRGLIVHMMEKQRGAPSSCIVERPNSVLQSMLTSLTGSRPRSDSTETNGFSKSGTKIYSKLCKQSLRENS